MQTPLGRALRPRTLAFALLLAAAGCAYYNTFYLARRYYREGEKAQERSVSGAASPEAVAKYDAVIRQCNKILVEYPKSKWVDDATYLMGASLYGKGDYTGAIKRLDELQTKFPQSPFVPEARLVQGLAYVKRKDYAIADSVLQVIAAAYPNFPRKWELFFHAGESKALQRSYDEALVWYRRAVGAAKARRERSDTLRRTGDALFAAGRMDSAQATYAQCLKVEERGTQRLELALKRGEALRELKRHAEALEFLDRWKPIAQTENREGDLALRITECMALLGRTDEAIVEYRRLVEKFPRSSVSSEAQFQIGYLYETAKSDLELAGKEYEKLRMEPDSEFKRQASRRAQSLVTMKEFRKTLESDTTLARARAAFRLAELYYFELGKGDSAIAQYRTVESLFPNSAYAPKSAFARLWIATHDRNDTLAAMGLTDTIASRYRGTRYAESALYLWKRWSGRVDGRTALLDSLMANPDTSAASRFVEEPEPEPSAELGAPGADRPDSGATIPPEVMRQLQEQSEAIRAQQRERAGRGQKTPSAVTADSSAVPADSARAIADSSATPPDTSRAPRDTTGAIRITPNR
jgi:TolA-binding protein